MKKLSVVELFAGVGGFRLGLEKNNYKVVWSNQWEPSTTTQHATLVYEARFGKETHSKKNIEDDSTKEIPDHDILVGGFPCQDYSVATTLKNSKGLKGKKGVLWWSIHRILEEKKNKPQYLLLENVDRLLKSPSSQRGRDFAVMLKSLDKLGYALEWRVINAAEYGMPQRRRRVFIVGYYKTSPAYQNILQAKPMDWLTKVGTMAKSFPVENVAPIKELELAGSLVEITKDFNKNKSLSPFLNTGMLIKGKVYTIKTSPVYKGKKSVLGDFLQNGEVTQEFYIKDSALKKPKIIVTKDGLEKVISTEQQMWQYLKGSKKEKRKTKEGFEYNYGEGAMIYPDPLDKPSRTIITGEGGKSPSRFKHVVQTKKGLRRLTPVELERLNMFPDDHTKLDGICDTKRAFFMGNALVVGVVEKIGEALYLQSNDR